ncbi:MAG TPA: hypothetical protein PKE69_03030 [Pyrinomonadaceae bacterium]|nr:hypothetical protein [Pyrinomonadaceae bacterium]
MNMLIKKLEERLLPEFEEVAERICQSFIILSFLGICLGCGVYTETETFPDRNYACKDYKLSAQMEIVDVETNGKRSGDTHFRATVDAVVFFSYNLTESSEKAIEEIRVKENTAKSVIRKSVIKDSQKQKIGEKLVFLSEDKLPISKTIEKKYNLLWSNEAMIYLVSSKSLAAIEEIKKTCNF